MEAWRELAVPHRDVLKGTFKQSEFAADLTQVVRGTAAKEYLHAQEFYRRTFIKDARFGKVHAACRTARTIFLGSAPNANIHTQQRGLPREHVLLGRVAVLILSFEQLPCVAGHSTDDQTTIHPSKSMPS